jgi:adenosine deaminase
MRQMPEPFDRTLGLKPLMIEDFQRALRAGNLEAIRKCPKTDLHNHGWAGADPVSVEVILGKRIVPLDHPLASMDEMHAWVAEHFGNPDPKLRPHLFEAAFARAAVEGVVRFEIGDDVWATTLDGSAENVTNILRGAHERGAPNVEWIPQLGMSRHCRIEDIRRWMEPFFELRFYRTLDLSGDEFAQPIENFKPLYRLAKANGLRLKAHVGEWGSADSVWRAVEELELDEVQHGIAAADSPAVMRFLADRRIRLNICPTSNLMLGRVETLASHPIRKLFDEGVRVTINTDDMAVFGQSVSQEFLNLYASGCLNEKELDQIRENGLSDD